MRVQQLSFLGLLSGCLHFTTVHSTMREAFAFLRKPPPLEAELGCSPTLGVFAGRTYFFDPFNLATDENFARYREAELKHGRVAMLATIGMVAPNVAMQAANENDLFNFNDVPSGLQAFTELPMLLWVQVFVTCAFLETAVFCQRNVQDMPGDYGTGYFGLRDKGRNERSLQCELENGRLAMIAFVVQIVLELYNGKPLLDQWQEIDLQAVVTVTES